MDKKTRYQKGTELIDKYADKSDKPAYSITFEDLMDMDTDLEKYIVEFAFGDIYSRTGLSDQQKTLTTITTLVTQGLEPQLRLHVNIAITIGITPREVIDTIIHLLPYVGFPRVLNGLKVAKEIFQARDVAIK
ncbi:MAG TPA: carboxymuconolactone decarboxylase family protein [Candidatus Sphingobacterium stercoripullorum]|uniref:Carboxymuconolactone decarboxylase family protein n=1 Tax=Candidatus Sphingobacterium stercoripullorum TaxID=2838759 RepID=A0A9D2AZC7_9SPHI|nr:carboxymuconolactone decarboxylase family protein [Candidatus Sphingobacterium stercoripullorum]